MPTNQLGSVQTNYTKKIDNELQLEKRKIDLLNNLIAEIA